MQLNTGTEPGVEPQEESGSWFRGLDMALLIRDRGKKQLWLKGRRRYEPGR